MNKEFINPNWHVIFLHLPLGIFVVGVLIEAMSFLYRHSAVRSVARGMIWLGALAALPAAYTGIYAFADVVQMATPVEAEYEGQREEAFDRPWHQTANAAAGLSDAQWDDLGGHVWCQSIATFVAALLATIGFGLSDRWRYKLQVPLMIGLLFSMVAMMWGGYYGGEMVYRYGTGVARVEHADADKGVDAVADTAGEASVEGAAVPAASGIEYFILPLQLHVTLAGFAAAISLAALGMSMRVLTTADQWRDPEVASARNLLDMEAGPRGGDDVDFGRTPDADSGGVPMGIPAGRFWLLAAGGTLLTSLAGVWFLSGLDEVGGFKPAEIWNAIAGKPRRLFHVITGGALLVLPLLLALAARFARRSKALLWIIGTVLLIALGVQVWLGILLLFDTPSGDIYRFNRAGEPMVTAAVE